MNMFIDVTSIVADFVVLVAALVILWRRWCIWAIKNELAWLERAMYQRVDTKDDAPLQEVVAQYKDCRFEMDADNDEKEPKL